jgi:hypothetical protein
MQSLSPVASSSDTDIEYVEIPPKRNIFDRLIDNDMVISINRIDIYLQRTPYYRALANWIAQHRGSLEKAKSIVFIIEIVAYSLSLAWILRSRYPTEWILYFGLTIGLSVAFVIATTYGLVFCIKRSLRNRNGGSVFYK